VRLAPRSRARPDLVGPLTSIGFDLFSELKSSGFFDDDLGDTIESDELGVQRGSQPET